MLFRSGPISGVEMFQLRYPDGAHDAEALFVDPLSHSLVILTKSLTGGAQPAYRVGTDLAAGSTTTTSGMRVGMSFMGISRSCR